MIMSLRHPGNACLNCMAINLLCFPHLQISPTEPYGNEHEAITPICVFASSHKFSPGKGGYTPHPYITRQLKDINDRRYF